MKQFNNKKAFSLIIVIFAMMLMAVLGWSMASLQSVDFEVGMRQFESERALYLAEAGTQWVLNQLSGSGGGGWRTDGETHTLGFGEYNVICCTPGEGSCPSEEADVVIISTGYVPAQTDYLAMRQVQINISLSGFDKVVTAEEVFDWHLTGGYYVDIDGDIQAEYYDGDGNGNPNEDVDLEVPGNGTRDYGPTYLSEINMGELKRYASETKGVVFTEDTTFYNGNYNNKGVYYVVGRVTIDLSGGSATFNNTSIIAEGNIEIIGSSKLTMFAYEDLSKIFPSLATENGNIQSLDTPTQGSGGRKINGLIFTKDGDIDFNYIDGIALMGVNVKLRGSIDLEYSPKYMGSGSTIIGAIGATDWQEQ